MSAESGIHCGHDPAQFVTADEGTGYCPACEAEAADPGSSSAAKERADTFPHGLRRIRESWAQTFKVGRHWRLAVEWIPAARSFDFWVYDERMNDGC